jgi:two-component system, LytTR family, response regulator LytT
MVKQIKSVAKKSKISNPRFHIAFWVCITFFIAVVFGKSWGSGLQAFYFISLLLPVVMGTSYFFNYFLVPQYLLKRKYFWFALYFYYMLVVSLYLEMLIFIFSFMYMANFELDKMAINMRDILLMAMVLYFVVFLGAFLLMVKQLFESHSELDELKTEKKKMEKPFLELISNRKLVRIQYENIIYIESLADYVKVHTEKKEDINSKEKISVLENLLPVKFLRIHRSFIVNTDKISRFNYNEVEIGDVVLNIGRSYKKDILPKLKSIE